jgi:hypothetical protein
MGGVLIWFALGLLGFAGWLAKRTIDFGLETFKPEVQKALREWARRFWRF